MKAYELEAAAPTEVATLKRTERPKPTVQPGEALVRIHAVSLNYRDIQILDGVYGVRPTVPVSDGAGEVVEVGPGTTRWKVGDRVVGSFWQKPSVDKVDAPPTGTGLGGEVEGVLAEYVAFKQDGLVAMPNHLTYEEAAALPCAAVTAWNALVVEGHTKAGDTVLLLGTGGVSVFALQFAKLMGARVIVTSSSDEKLKLASQLRADVLINYKKTPAWDEEVLKVTGGKGANLIIDLGGSATLGKSLNAVHYKGKIEIVGVISGIEAEITIPQILGKRIQLQGISVGEVRSFEDMNLAIQQAGMKPVIDRVFSFQEAAEAYAYLRSGEHFGKVVISL